MAWYQRYIFIIIIILLVTFSLPNFKAEETLKIQVNIDKDTYDYGELVRISGIVSLEDGTPLSNALISIQVSGPNYVVHHIALTYSDGEGKFTDEYYHGEGDTRGLYTVYVKGSKVGFSDAEGQIQYTVIPEFSFPIKLMLIILVLSIFIIYGRKYIHG